MKQFSFKSISGLSVALIVSLTSCTSRNTPVDTSKMEREPIDYEVITDSIYSSFPAYFIYTGRYVVWTDLVYNFNIFDGNFIHVVDPELKKEVAAMGRKGNGPNEFNDPTVERYNGDTVYVYDLNLPRQALFPLTGDTEGGKNIFPLPPQPSNIGHQIFISKESQVYFNSEFRETPFRYIIGTDSIPFGKYCVDDADIEDRFALEMNLEYDANLEMLKCKASNYPYIALYKKTGNSFELMTEIKGDLSDNSVKTIGVNGILSNTLTKNYLVAIGYDYDNGEVPPRGGRDTKTLPRNLFVRDHNGNLLRIFRLDEPTLRLSGCGKDNILYAIIAPQDPDRDESQSEFELVRIDLEKAMSGK